jgi:hypothetical protein
VQCNEELKHTAVQQEAVMSRTGLKFHLEKLAIAAATETKNNIQVWTFGLSFFDAALHVLSDRSASVRCERCAVAFREAVAQNDSLRDQEFLQRSD